VTALHDAAWPAAWMADMDDLGSAVTDPEQLDRIFSVAAS
jgi:hypothetical protein